MKLSTYSRGLAAFVSALALAGGASAQTSPNQVGPYFSLGAGTNQPEKKTDVELTGNPTTRAATVAGVSFDLGTNIAAAAGYKWASGLRGELEFGWRRADVKNVNGASWSGREEIFGIMGNMLFDLNAGNRFQPYVGAGLGVGRTRFKNVTGAGTNSVPVPAIFSGHDTGFQWQLIGGVSAAVSERVTLFADYRYIRLNDVNISSRSNPNSMMLNRDDSSHNILVGVRFAFGPGAPAPMKAAAAAPPPPPPPAARPAPPPPPPAPTKFLAFFDFDKANLRADAKEIVAQAARQAKAGNETVIRITGHADTSGTNDYNLGLSKRRAEAVKAELVRQGIPDREVNVSYKGESEPLVQTGDGVKEPQNRRVEIVYE